MPDNRRRCEPDARKLNTMGQSYLPVTWKCCSSRVGRLLPGWGRTYRKAQMSNQTQALLAQTHDICCPRLVVRGAIARPYSVGLDGWGSLFRKFAVFVLSN